MKYLVTGGAGFLGSNLGYQILRNGEELIVFDNLYRQGSDLNLDWLRQNGANSFIHGDMRNQHDVFRVIDETRPDVIFHLCGQVAMTTSIANPRMDFEVNALGSFNLLEAVRLRSPESIIVYSSTNKVYGDLQNLCYTESELRYDFKDFPDGIDEQFPIDFHSPYGCSKGTADQYMLDYARIFQLRTVVFRHSSIYGGRQYSTFDQGWVGWFCSKAYEAKRNPQVEFTISGTGKQVRDVLFVTDAVKCYLSAAKNIDKARGQVFNIGGGVENSLSLLELFTYLEQTYDLKLRYRKLPWRESDQKVFIANITKAMNVLDWKPTVQKSRGIHETWNWTRECHDGRE